MTNKHVAIYVGVSSRDRDTANQERELKRWAASQDGPVRWYRDRGPTRDRPGWTKLRKAVRAGTVSALVVWRLDRLGQTARGLTALFEDLHVHKVNLVSLEEGLDLSNASGRRVARVIASVAQAETAVRAERVRAGQAVARAQGAQFGRPRGPGKPLKITPDMEAHVRQLKKSGLKIAAIARDLGLARPTIYRLLERRQRTATRTPGHRGAGSDQRRAGRGR